MKWETKCLGTRSSRVLSTKADMFSLGMVIHFMAFKGRLPYIATGETLESLNDLRREVQSFPGYFSSNYIVTLTLEGTYKMINDMNYLMNYTNY